MEVKAAFWSIFDDIDEPPGEKAVAEATRRARVFADRYGQLYPKAVACLSDDFASLTVHLRFPRQHSKRVRHSNFIERTFGESRWRVKVIGRLPGETSCLSLVWAVLDRASRGWRGVTQHRRPSVFSRTCAASCWNHRSTSARTGSTRRSAAGNTTDAEAISA